MGKNILIGITGGIAAYKTIDLIHMFVKNGHATKIILTPYALNFVTPLTIQTISKHHPYLDKEELVDDEIEHIELAKWADLMLVAPATANTIGKIAHGLADNLLTSTVFALPKKTPLLLAPAMNTRMWENPLLQENLKTIRKFYKNCLLIEPRKSLLACGEEGMGAMAEISELFAAVNKKFK